MLIDRFNREITYLRVSVTDRCNFRCAYCMPAGGIAWRPHSEILTYEEISEVIRVGAEMGIRRVRLTGGEPLVRRDLPRLVKMISSIPGIDEISLTTNATLLEPLARPLKLAGLSRVNISLDTLKPDKFERITRGGDFEQAWKGILAAEAAGLSPIKINAVALRGVNGDELLDLARLTLTHDWQVRFIEFMPVANGEDWGPGFPSAHERYLPVDEIRKLLVVLDIEQADPTSNPGPARVYRIPGARGTIGIISPVGEHFCWACNRLRLTADGNLRPCLLNDTEVPLRDAMRKGEAVRPLIEQAILVKPKGHSLAQEPLDANRRMVQIGG